MKTIMQIGLLALFTLVFCSTAYAQNCDGLSPAAQKVAQDVMTTSYVYDCCDDTIAACVAKENACKLAKRLHDEVCRLAAAGKSAKDIKHLLEQRAMAMNPALPQAKIELRPEFVWGNPEAKVVLSIYVCARCPYCSRHVPALISALEKTTLKDKVAINLRLFPIKSHDNSTPAALAVEAAARMGKAWDYILNAYAHFDEFSLRAIPELGKMSGLDAEQFDKLRKDPAVREAVVSSKKEGFINNVETTPTTFINGRKINGAFDVETIISMLEEALDNLGEEKK